MTRVVGGATNRQHLEVKARHSAEARKRLVDPEIPPGCAHVWTWFMELNQTRRGTAGPAGYIEHSISFTELANWAWLTGRNPTPGEVALLRGIDRLWLQPDDDTEG